MKKKHKSGVNTNGEKDEDSVFEEFSIDKLMKLQDVFQNEITLPDYCERN